jgi:hypothetical protein
MKPTVTILIGAPVSGDEARFLQKLATDLAPDGGVILANFVVGERQIDFVVVTPTCAALLELKNFSRPIFGDRNGTWTYLDAGNNRVPYSGMNPWRQTVEQKYALSDAMRAYRRRTPSVPGPSGSSFYGDFDAYVCVYPAVHRDSRVTAGDQRAAVASYADVVNAIRIRRNTSTWTSTDWEKFAATHLHLTRVSLEEAIDLRIQNAHAAIDRYCERIQTILGTGLPPLIESTDGLYGPSLVFHALQPQNFLMLGPSGSAKTFHLHHIAIACASGETEVPLLIDAARFRGGEFWNLLRHGTAPFFGEDPRELIEATRHCGRKPVLLVDALNECGGSLVGDLLKGIQAFALRFDARVVFTSQRQFQLTSELKAEVISLRLPADTQKRIIYGYHAHLPASPELDRFCAGFTNAYDLTVAGRCHDTGPPPRNRGALYDRYVRQCLPHHTAVLGGLIRTIASVMSEEITLAISRDRFERLAESFLTQQGASLELIDVLAGSRLARVSRDSFAFEHELLAKYFRAETLRRAVRDTSDLATELRRPINQDLLEFVLPQFAHGAELAELLDSTNDIALLSDVCAGKFGKSAQGCLIEEMKRLLDTAIEDVRGVAVRCVSCAVADGRRRLTDIEIYGTKNWTSREGLVCAVIARHLGHPELLDRFLNLLDRTESVLREVVQKAASESGFDFDQVWEEVVRLYGGVLMHGTLKLPCTAILSGLRNHLMQWHEHHDEIPIRNQMLERASRNPGSHFSLLALLQDHEAAAASEYVLTNMELIRRAWASGIYILQVDALEFVQYMGRAVDDADSEKQQDIRSMLESFETDNIVVNTARLEALTSYGGMEIGITANDAQEEMRSLISMDAATDPHVNEIAKACGITPLDWLSGCAYGCLGRIFEDIFQGVYCEAYYAMSPEERAQILYLAAQSPNAGYLIDWILQELLKVADERALPVYRRFASTVKSGTTATTQEVVTAFELGLAGCARWSEQPPAYNGGDCAAEQAWKTIGEILFWLYRSRITNEMPNLEGLWAELKGEALVSAGDTLHRLADADRRGVDGSLEGPNLVRRFPREIRRIALACLSHKGEVPSIFPYGGFTYGGLTGYMLHLLGVVADEADVPVIRRFVEDPEVGKIASSSIEQINIARLEGPPS